MITKWIIFVLSTMVLLSFADSQNLTLHAVKGESFINYILIHPLHKVEAVCKDLTCTIQYDNTKRTIISTTFSADVSSFDSGNSNRDSHAMEVLDALIYPTVSFESKEIKNKVDGLEVIGDLTFHGVTKRISLPVTVQSKSSALVINGKTNVSLAAFKIERPSLLFIPVEDTLRISFNMVFETK